MDTSMIEGIIWSDFHFLRPDFLWLLIPAALLLWKGMNKGGGKDGWEQSCDPELLQAMQVQAAQKGSKLQWLYWPAALIAILAISGPAVRKVPVPVVQNQSALVLALDVSRSMLADDIKPSRLQRAKFKIKDLLADRKDGQTALVVYAGDAFVVTPLTDDVATICAMLEAIEPSIMPVKGTNTSKALEKAADLLKQSGARQGEVLLITDSISLLKTEDTLSELANQKIKTHVMAVGTEAGAPIPTPRGFVKDLRGQIVIPKLDFKSLQQAAVTGGGYFTVLSSGDDFAGMFDAKTNADQGDEENSADNPFKDDDLGSENFIDDGPLLALLLLPLVAMLYRRGMLLFLALAVVLPVEQSHALSWDDLWLNEDQQAWKHLQNNEVEQAQNTAIDPKIQAAAAYKNKQFKQAADLYGSQDNALDKHYNEGNALAQAGEFEKALDSYEQALTYNPEDEDTLYNKKIVEEALKQQQEQEQQQQNEQGEPGEESDEEKSGDQEQDSEQQNQEQQDQDEQQQEQESNEQKQQAEKDEQSEEANEDQAEQEQQQADEEREKEEKEQQEVELTPEEKALDAEEKQAMEQWLRRIKDDPGGLLRRKFLYQYHRRNQSDDDFQTTEDW
ncbi:vWA domain-containing protein [Marinicella rhabdoformis]|uniref:vWA domain-containing protein n=1 Tax=Marinicella rhabdoformis TaxID=2580566 RepID=UPI0015D00C07|nr:VWA domain-containing protein [Marinicella rhabdoformis]